MSNKAMGQNNITRIQGRVVKSLGLNRDKIYTADDLKNIFSEIGKLKDDGTETQQTIIEKINAIFDAFIGGEE